MEGACPGTVASLSNSYLGLTFFSISIKVLWGPDILLDTKFIALRSNTSWCYFSLRTHAPIEYIKLEILGYYGYCQAIVSYTYTKLPDCVDIIRCTSMRFSQLLPWKHESVGRVLSGHQLLKQSDVRCNISTHVGSFVFIIHAT